MLFIRVGGAKVPNWKSMRQWFSPPPRALALLRPINVHDAAVIVVKMSSLLPSLTSRPEDESIIGVTIPSASFHAQHHRLSRGGWTMAEPVDGGRGATGNPFTQFQSGVKATVSCIHSSARERAWSRDSCQSDWWLDN